MAKWYWLCLTYATGGIAVQNGQIVHAAPIFKWTVGKSLHKTVAYFKAKNQFKELVGLDSTLRKIRDTA